MATSPLHAEAVRDVLRALRFARPLVDSSLMDLDLISLRMRREGLAESKQSRSWALGRCVEDVVRDQLAELRGVKPQQAGPAATWDRTVAMLQSDLGSQNEGRLNLALLQVHYLSAVKVSVRQVGEALGMAERTVYYRVMRGVDALTEALIERDAIAERDLLHVLRERPHERIVVSNDRQARSTNEVLKELLAALRDQRRIVRVTPEQLAAASEHPSAGMVAYRVGRVAAWTQPRYRLDERFVALSLLVDLGEESLSGRWQERAERLTDLRDVLAEVEEPAVVLLGPPGSGKSTLLRKLELELAVDALASRQGGAALPLTFLVSLNQYRPAVAGEEPPAPMVWLAAQWALRFPMLAPLDEVLAEHDMVFLLDGINEMPHRSRADYRDLVLLWKAWLHERLGGARRHRAVFACRSLDYSAPLSTPSMRVPQVRLQPLSDDQVEGFLKSYHPGLAGEQWASLQETRALSALRRPFFLRLLGEGAAASGELHLSVAALLTSFARRALVREIKRDNPTLQPGPLVDAEDIARVAAGEPWHGRFDLPERGSLFSRLSELAYRMQTEAVGSELSQVRISTTEALRLLDCEEAASILVAGRELGILDEDRSTRDIMFQHQLLQEYFAARRLAVAPVPEHVCVEWRASRVPRSVNEVLDELGPGDTLPGLPQTGWEETTLLAVALSSEPMAFLRGIMSSNLALAGRAADLPDVASRLSSEFLTELRWGLVERCRAPEADLRDRMACGFALGDLGDPRFEEHIGSHGPYLWPPLAEIPGGTYPIGDDEPIEWRFAEAAGINDAHMPSHRLSIDPFRIGCFPVTNAEWAHFIAAGGYEDERWWETDDALAWRRGTLVNEAGKRNSRFHRQRFLDDPAELEAMIEEGRFHGQDAPARWRRWLNLDDEEFEKELDVRWQGEPSVEPRFWRDERYNHPAQPVVGVCWYEARAYAAWLVAQSGLAVRLPTEVEWEAAARGTDGRAYPWGEVFDRSRANTADVRIGGTSPVGVFPDGDSPAGVSDLCGNVGEWTSSLDGEGRPIGEMLQGDFTYPYDPDDGREDAAAPSTVCRVGRGASWEACPGNARAVFRDRGMPAMRHNLIGLRLVVEASGLI